MSVAHPFCFVDDAEKGVGVRRGFEAIQPVRLVISYLAVYSLSFGNETVLPLPVSSKEAL